jgi:hypothetical protein
MCRSSRRGSALVPVVKFVKGKSEYKIIMRFCYMVVIQYIDNNKSPFGIARQRNTRSSFGLI